MRNDNDYNKYYTNLHPWRKRILIGLSTLLVLLMGGIAVLASTGFKLSVTGDKGLSGMYQKSKATSNNDKLKSNKNGAQIGILIMGVDNDKVRKLDTTRTDSLIYVTYNQKSGKLKMTSIPRDTYTTIYDGTGNPFTQNGKIVKDKINASYTVDKENSTIDTVKHWLNVPVDYYVRANFVSFKKVVNDIGGIDAKVPYDLSEKDETGKRIYLKKGWHHLNGAQALTLARTRHHDNDVKRGERQQEIVWQIVKKTLKVGDTKTYDKLFKSVKGDVKTNLTFENCETLAGGMIGKKFTHESYTFTWNDYNENGASAVQVYDDSRAYISHKMRVNLGLDEKDGRDAKGYKFVSSGTDKDINDLDTVDDLAKTASDYVPSSDSSDTGSSATSDTANGNEDY